MVSDQAFPAQGGEGIATQNLCTRLSERGHEVLLLTSEVFHPPVVQGIEIVRFPSVCFFQKGHFAIVSSTRIVPLLKERKIQIIHVNLPTFLGWQSFLAARKLDIPRVAGFHVQVGNVIPYNLPPFSFCKNLLELWFSYFYKMADVLISPSNLGKKILSDYSSGKVEVVSNGVDFNVFNPDAIAVEERDKFRRRFGLGASPFLLYVGRLSREKNIFYLLKIMQLLKEKNDDVKLLIVGRGELRDLLQKRAGFLGVEERVIFAGFIHQSDLLCAYREADIFILPSWFELQGMVVLEAMAMKCAIMVSKSSESAAWEMVEEGVNGYTFNLKDPHDAAEKIHFILSSPTLKKSMQQASFLIVKEHDIERSISKVEKLYGELVF